MKKILFLLCICPIFLSAQEIYDEHKFPNILLESRSRSEPSLRSDQLPDAPLDSTYVYENTFGDESLIARYIYQFDDSYIMKRHKTAYSGDKVLYDIKTNYSYEPRKHYWIEQIDSIFEFNKYTAKSRTTRTYNEDSFLTDYREYESNYDSPWGDARQIYTAVEFNDKNMPTLFMDTTYVIISNADMSISPMIYKWEITYDNNTVKEMVRYIQVNEEWLPEIKYVITYDHFWITRTMDILTKKDDAWSVKIGEIITHIDGRDNKTSYQKKNESYDIIQSYRFQHYYDESATNIEEIKETQGVEIQLDNNSRILTVNIQDSPKAEVMLITASGHIALKQSINQPTVQISLANLPAGYYIVSIQSSGQYRSQAIILK